MVFRYILIFMSGVAVCSAPFQDHIQKVHESCLGENKVHCDDTYCINTNQYCDQKMDCPDGSDELMCLDESKFSSEECFKKRYFKCADDSRCLPLSLVCNNETDCDDHSDEMNCTTITEDEEMTQERGLCRGFLCESDKKCISQVWICDGRYDCEDRSDESLEACRSYHGDHSPNDVALFHPEDVCYHCLDGMYCVRPWRMCDGMIDCRDGSDEGPFCDTWLDQCTNKSVCAPPSICRRERAGVYCICPSYKEYNTTLKQCLPYDSCNLAIPSCSQICTDKKGPHLCSCEEGYSIDVLKIGVGCFAPDPEGLLFFSTRNDIRYVTLKSKQINVVASELKQAHGMAYDGKYIFWVESAKGHQSIVRAELADVAKTKQTVVALGLEDPGDVATDWLGGHFYFTDAERGTISVCNSNGSICTTLNTTAKVPRHIVLDVKKGKMYWLDYDNGPVIMSAQMDGSNSTVLTRDLKTFPNSLALDAPGSRIYFVDQTVRGAHVETGETFVVFDEPIHRPYSAAVFENSIYFSDWTSGTIQAIGKLLGVGGNENIYRVNTTVFGMHLYHPILLKDRSASCVAKQCSHLCLPVSNTTVRCACPEGMILMDSKKCVDDPKFKPQYLVVAGGINITRIKYNTIGNPEAESTNLDVGRVQAMTFDDVKEVVYIYDSWTRSIRALRMDDFMNGITSIYYDKGFDNVVDMAFDYIFQNLYVIDDGRRLLEVISSVNKHRAIVKRFQEIPVNIVALPEHGKLLILLKKEDEFGVYQYRIDTIGMDGTDQRTIVKNDLKGPRIHMQYSESLDSVFLADESSGIIDYMHYEGIARENFRELSTTVTGLAIADPYIFWTDRRSTRIYWSNLYEATPRIRRIELSIFPNNTHLHVAASKTPSAFMSRADLCPKGTCAGVCVQNPHLPVDPLYHHTCICPPNKRLVRGDCVEAAKCTNDQTYCHDSNQCIRRNQICDGRKDCRDGEDEIGCSEGRSRCPSDEVLCENVCIKKYDTCQKNTVSEDCDPMQFRCAFDVCIDRAQMCDGKEDCKDGSDESKKLCAVHQCLESEFMCTSGQCVLNTFVCDGELDCNDGSDEFENCEGKVCTAGQFQCLKSRKCIDLWRRCDAQLDCEDGSDEEDCMEPYDSVQEQVVEPENCNEWEHTCELNRSICIPFSAWCNGKPDCPGHTDELSCHAFDMCTKAYSCNGDKIKCIHFGKVCDGSKDCDDGSDEWPSTCSRVNRTSKVYPLAYKGYCHDGYTCKNGQCIEWSELCDKKFDCSDKSDEGKECTEKCDSHNCSHACRSTPKGDICVCKLGYRLGSDSRSCVDVDECEHDVCSQMCHNMPGSFVCSCHHGYAIGPDRRSCKARNGKMSILYVSGNTVRSIAADGTTTVEYTNDLHDGAIADLDYDFHKNHLYLTLPDESKLILVDDIKNGTVISNIGRPTKVAVDWITGNVYFADTSKAMYIRVCHTISKRCARLQKLVPSDAEVTALVVDPLAFRMFYCLTKDLESIIWSSTLAGQDVADIATVHNCTGLAVDTYRRLLYVAETSPAKISKMDYKGGSRKIIIEDNMLLQSPHDLEIFEDHIYYLVANSFKLNRCLLYGAKQCEMYLQRTFAANSFVIRHEVAQRVDVQNLCQNLFCDSVCVTDGYSPMCVCSDGALPKEGYCSGSTGAVEPAVFKENKSMSPTAIFLIFVVVAVVLFVVYALFAYWKRHRPDPNATFQSVQFRNVTPDEGESSLVVGEMSPDASSTHLIIPQVSPDQSAEDEERPSSSASGYIRREYLNPLFEKPIDRLRKRFGTPDLTIDMPPDDVSEAEDVDDRDTTNILTE